MISGKMRRLLTPQMLKVMKLTFILLTIAFLQVGAKGISQTITYSGKNVKLETVFSEIKKQTGFVFFYSSQDMALSTLVTIKLDNSPVELALKEVLNNQPLTFIIKDKTVFIKAKPVSTVALQPTVTPPNETFLTTIDVSGKVMDADGNPLAGASVKVKGTTIGTTTNADGTYTLKGIDENATLIFSYAEHETIELKVNNRTSITASLKRTEGNLQEVVINKGYYTEKQRYSLGNVGKVTAKDIEKQPVNNPLLALQGRVPGIEITPTSGIAGSAIKVQIRGRNSIGNGNDPLYVIDGVPYNSQLLPGVGEILGSTATEFRGSPIYGNPLSFINSNDIESIEVLKDADATAIYGSRAANGAILITTKRGKPGKLRVNINAYTGWGKAPSRMSLLNLRQYLDMRYEALKNDGLAPDPNLDFDLTAYDTTKSTDWQKFFIGKTAHYNNLQASVSGGSTQTQYLVGAGFSKETTVFPGDFSDNKGSVHFNLTSRSNNEKLQLMLTGSYSVDDNRLFREDLTKYIRLAPNTPALLGDDGSLNWAQNSLGITTVENPLAVTLQKFKGLTTNLVSSAQVFYKLKKGLEIKTSFGYNVMNTNETSTVPILSFNPDFRSYVERSSNFADNRIQSWIIEPQLSYVRSMRKSKIEALIGGTLQSNNRDGSVLEATGFVSDALIENRKAASTIRITSLTSTKYKYNALFGRFNYNWGDKYLINLTGRRDGSSRFGPAKQLHNFASVGVGWIFSNEQLVKKQFDFISFGKIKASYGTSGNDQVGDYRFLDLYSPTSLLYQGTTGLSIDNLFNPELAWEETRKLEIGTDLGLFKDRINLNISWYRNQSSNQLAGYSLPTTTGFARIDANQDTKVENKGWEFQFNTVNIKSKNLEWASSFNLATNKNKILSFGPNYFGSKRAEGKSLNSTFVNIFARVDPVTGEYQFLDKKGNITSMPDTMIFIDLNPEYYGGLQNSFTYKDIELDFLLQFVKQKGANNFFGTGAGPGVFNTSSPNQTVDVLQRWQKPGDVKTVQRYNSDYSLYPQSLLAQNSNAAYSDASFIRLKNIALSYKLSKSVIEKLHMQNVRIYLQCQNLLTIYRYKGGDPELRTINSLPQLRVITAGAQFTF